MQVLEGRIDHTRVVTLVRRGQHLGVVKDYLLAVQKNNLVAVNEALNELHISEDDHEGVDASVAGYDNFDQLKLAEELEVPRSLCSRFSRSVCSLVLLCYVLCCADIRGWCESIPDEFSNGSSVADCCAPCHAHRMHTLRQRLLSIGLHFQCDRAAGECVF